MSISTTFLQLLCYTLLGVEISAGSVQHNAHSADYCEMGPTTSPGAAGGDGSSTTPAILFVHGFGAFGDHWRGNMEAAAAAGYHVFAPTLPG